MIIDPYPSHVPRPLGSVCTVVAGDVFKVDAFGLRGAALLSFTAMASADTAEVHCLSPIPLQKPD